ncbi:hypothetical protein IQ254_29240 [Nodosilinea sp. LEGE 07088]|uniref:hypothetical protein n=1 Tax=Nodosilinea sp. LEGE 07088 TaxID=2777968 RepID=UPI0018804FEB|nr:hypothetical protein [Nodosilinea sp. LEGE 07088]MBE9141238.1 hypothetical protein [Nodosilinea sp. LEGE 07088]
MSSPLKSILGKIYTMLTSGDGTVPNAKDGFIAWCIPGIPFNHSDLLFANKLFATDADQARDLLNQASNFSRLVNFIPDASSGIFDLEKQEAIYSQTGKTLWSAYETILNTSEVVDKGDLSPDRQSKLDKWRKLLVEVYEDENIITEEIEQKTRPGRLVRAYTDKQNHYINACLEYNAKRIAAMYAESPVAVQDWTLNAFLYRLKVQNAYNVWVAEGYKNEYETIMATINQWTKQSLVLWKQKLLDNLTWSKQTDLVNNQEFYLTTFWPPQFATTQEGWTDYKLEQKTLSKYAQSQTNAWDMEVGAGIGLFGGSVSAGVENGKLYDELNTSNFNINFEIVQIPLLRPWFNPEFLASNAWRFRSDSEIAPISDGGRPPKGFLPTYPTTAIFIRRLKADFSELHDTSSSYTQAIKAGLKVGYGPFCLSGNYHTASGDSKVENTLNQEGLTVEGLQLIGFKCAIVPKSPNPSPTITDWA